MEITTYSWLIALQWTFILVHTKDMWQYIMSDFSKENSQREMATEVRSFHLSVCVCARTHTRVLNGRGRVMKQEENIGNGRKLHLNIIVINWLPILILSYFIMDGDGQTEAQLPFLLVIKVLEGHPGFPVDGSWISFYSIWRII